ncbi:MAG: CPBP family intramembrane glutamic endopeptidase [Candidatus Methanofastidiosia archaeon]
MNGELLNILTSILTLVVLFLTIKFLSSKLKFEKSELRFENPRKDAILAIAIVLITFFLVFLAMYHGHEEESPMPQLHEKRYTISGILNQIFFILIVSIPAFIYLLSKKPTPKSLGISRLNLKNSIMMGLILSFILLLAEGKLTKLNTLTSNHFFALLYYTVIGFWEEIYFRGFLQLRMCAWLGEYRGFILTSVIFGFSHLPQRLFVQKLDLITSVESAFFTIIPGFILGYLMLKTRNVVAPGIFHTFINFANTIE